MPSCNFQKIDFLFLTVS